MRTGRPRKYDERRMRITLEVPELLIEKFDDIAYERKLTRTQIINGLLVQADMEESVRLNKKFDFLTELISKLNKGNRDCIEELNKFKGESISESIYGYIEPDDISKQAFENIKPDFEKIWNAGKMDNHNKKHWINVVIHEMNSITINEGKFVKSEQTAIQMIRILFMKEFKGF